jgi:hypothetical protein
VRLHLTSMQYAELRTYLFHASERVAFLFTPSTHSGDDAQVAMLWLLDDRDYRHANRLGVELAEHVRPELIRIAHQHRYAVTEAHAHDWPGPGTRFSTVDLNGLSDLGPHMTWRLDGQPYTALVLGPDSFDALQWHPSGEITTIDALLVNGEPLYPTGLSHARLTDHLSREQA